MKIFDQLGIDIGYVLLGVIGVLFILLIFTIILLVKLSKLKKKYYGFMQGQDGKSLEDAVMVKFKEIDTIKEILKKYQIHFNKTDETLKTVYQKMGIVKYDAFKEMGGNLSFALALLNQENNGFIINSMHSSREGCYTYIKEIINGESFVVLAEEEQKALDKAIKSTSLVEK